MLPLALLLSAAPMLAPPATRPKNVLYFLIDDLRPQMKIAYRQEMMHTPAFDQLATESLVFSRAFCQIAVCAPSRSSFMSGVRPDMTGIFNFANHIRDPGFNKIVSMPQQFKSWNYTVLGGGKTYHYDHPPYFDDTGAHGSWSSEVAPYFFFREYKGSVDFAECPLPGGYVGNAANLDPQVCALDGPLDQFYDYRLSNHTMGSLRLAKEVGKPFFVMAGFRRPHRVFQVARRFWDLYPAETSQIRVAKVQVRDPSQPEIAFHHGDFTLANGSCASVCMSFVSPLSLSLLAPQWNLVLTLLLLSGCLGACRLARQCRPALADRGAAARAQGLLRGRIPD